jgi:hypothetical protein
MKHIVITTALALVLVGSFTTAQAQEEKKKKERPPLTEEQKALMKEITGKYDTDKDGKLSPEERAKISPEDKEKMTKAGLGRGPGKGKDGEKKKE